MSVATTQSNPMQILAKVAEIATVAGMKVQMNEEHQHIQSLHVLPNGRTQAVYIRCAGRTPGDQDYVTFFSPCLCLKKGFRKGLNKEMAVDLLVKNEQIPFARFGVWPMEGQDMIVASVDQLLDTMDADEYKTHAWCVAMVADAFEAKHGQDLF